MSNRIMAREMHISGFEDVGRGPQTEECRQPLETGKGKETDSPLEAPDRNTALPTP